MNSLTIGRRQERLRPLPEGAVIEDGDAAPFPTKGRRPNRRQRRHWLKYQAPRELRRAIFGQWRSR